MTETSVSYVTDRGYTWQDILQRLRGIGDQVPAGAARVTITMLICDGDPVQWFAPNVERLEPRRAARQFVECASRE